MKIISESTKHGNKPDKILAFWNWHLDFAREAIADGNGEIAKLQAIGGDKDLLNNLIGRVNSLQALLDQVSSHEPNESDHEKLSDATRPIWNLVNLARGVKIYYLSRQALKAAAHGDLSAVLPLLL